MDNPLSEILDWGNPGLHVLPDDGRFTTHLAERTVFGYVHRSMIYYHWRKRYDLAIADLDEALRLDGMQQALFFRMRADFYAKLGAYEFAIFSLGEAIDCFGTEDLFMQRACYAYEIGNHTLALADLNTIITSKPLIDKALAFLVRGIVYQDLCHDYKSAVLDYNRALSNSWELKGPRRSLAEERRQQVLDLLNKQKD